MAAGVALELLAWDKNRASPGPGPDGREGLIARGADCYQRLIYSLHEEGPGDPSDDCEEWLRESGEMRLRRSDMTKKRLFGRGFGPPNLSEHDIDLMNRLRPELSFTRLVRVPTGDKPVEEPDGDDLIARFERLRSLREDGTLSEDESAVAKARLLG